MNGQRTTKNTSRMNWKLWHCPEAFSPSFFLPTLCLQLFLWKSHSFSLAVLVVVDHTKTVLWVGSWVENKAECWKKIVYFQPITLHRASLILWFLSLRQQRNHLFCKQVEGYRNFWDFLECFGYFFVLLMLIALTW